MSKARRQRQQRRTVGKPQGPDLLWALGLTLLAWVHRLAFLRSNRDWTWPYTLFYEGDSETFYEYARALLDGRLYDNGIPFHPPGFAWVLAAVHTLVGAGPGTGRVPFVAVKVVIALIGSLPVGLLYLLVRPYLGRVAALVASLLCAWSFGLYVIGVAPVTEGTYLTLLMLALLVWTRRMAHPLAAPDAVPGGWKSALGLGLILGFAALTRAEGVLVAILMMGVGLLGLSKGVRLTGANLASQLPRPRPSSPRPSSPDPSSPPSSGEEGEQQERLSRVPLSRGGGWGGRERGRGEGLGRGSSEARLAPRGARLRPWVLVALGWALAVAPWTIRNAVRLSEINERLAGQMAEPLPTFVPLTIYGPLNLALANNSQADGTFSRDFLSSRSHKAVLDLTDAQHLEFILHGDRMAWSWMRENPTAFARLVTAKWKLFFSAWKLGWTQWDWPGGLDGVRRPVDVLTPDSDAGWWLGLPFAILGLVCCLSTPGGPRRWAALVLLLTAAGMITTGLYFGYVRQGLLLLPFWLTLSATALVWIGERLRRLASGFTFVPLEPSRRLLQVLGGVALVLLALELWGMGANRNFQATGTNLPDRPLLDRDQPVYLKVLPAATM